MWLDGYENVRSEQSGQLQQQARAPDMSGKVQIMCRSDDIENISRKKWYGIQCPKNMGPASTCLDLDCVTYQPTSCYQSCGFGQSAVWLFLALCSGPDRQICVDIILQPDLPVQSDKVTSLLPHWVKCWLGPSLPPWTESDNMNNYMNYVDFKLSW